VALKTFTPHGFYNNFSAVVSDIPHFRNGRLMIEAVHMIKNANNNTIILAQNQIFINNNSQENPTKTMQNKQLTIIEVIINTMRNLSTGLEWIGDRMNQANKHAHSQPTSS
jgi:hypothetical protein